jgi:hypothetical protein
VTSLCRVCLQFECRSASSLNLVYDRKKSEVRFFTGEAFGSFERFTDSRYHHPLQTLVVSFEAYLKSRKDRRTHLLTFFSLHMKSINASCLYLDMEKILKSWRFTR